MIELICWKDVMACISIYYLYIIYILFIYYIILCYVMLYYIILYYIYHIIYTKSPADRIFKKHWTTDRIVQNAISKSNR